MGCLYGLPTIRPGATAFGLRFETGLENPGGVGVVFGMAKEAPSQSSGSKLIGFLMSLGLAAGGGWLAYTYSYVPYEGALTGATNVTLNAKGLIMGSVACVLGSAMLVSFAIPDHKPLEGEVPPQRKVLGAIVLLAAGAAFVASVVGYFWLRSFLKDHGYEV
jgi:hypothetical protein